MELDIARYIRVAFRREFVSAELFAALAILTLGLKLVGPSYSNALYHPNTITTLFLTPRGLQVFIALVCVISALAYGGLAQWSSQSLNKFLIVVQFVLLAIGDFLIALAVVSFASALSYARHEGATVYIVWHPPILAIGATSVALGCLAFVVNLGMTAIKIFGTRRRIQP